MSNTLGNVAHGFSFVSGWQIFFFYSRRAGSRNKYLVCNLTPRLKQWNEKWKIERERFGSTMQCRGFRLMCYLSRAVHLHMLTNCATGLGPLVIRFQHKHFLSGISIINSVWTHPQMNNEINNENVITFGSWVISRFLPPTPSACFLLINFPRSCPPFSAKWNSSEWDAVDSMGTQSHGKRKTMTKT